MNESQVERKSNIIIHKRTHATVAVECSDSIASELNGYFSAFAPNYMWSPLYKNRIWDGRIKFFKIATNELPIGLVDELYEFAKKGKYTIECLYERYNKITREEFKKFVDSLDVIVYDADGNRTEIRPYQIEAAYQCCIRKTVSAEAATSAGKSLIIYIMMRFMVHMKKRSIIICSGTGLVEQMFKDFQSYGWDAERYCHRIYAGQKKFFEAPVIIACWQSMVSTKIKTMNPYEDFDCLLVDEAHGAKAESIKQLAHVCINAEYRYGFSGTYPDKAVADWYTVVGSLGQIIQFASYKFLQDNGYITPLKIYNVVLNHSVPFKLKVYDECAKDYPAQNNMIHGSVERNNFIVKMIQNLNENVLVLFTKKESHGYILKEIFERELKDKMILYIDGDVPVSEREEVRAIMEANSNVVLIGSYGCVSQGTNIKNLGSIIFASGYKSRVKTLQSIGRSLRLHKDKKYAKLFDIVDDCSFVDRATKTKFVNYSMIHYQERAKFYIEEDWNVKTVKYQL